jgi:CBS domain-containing membrane protein
MTHNPVSSSLLHGRLAARFEWLRGALGGLVGLGLAAALSHWLIGDNAALPWLIAPMGASTVLLFAIPASPFAQPWPILGGHLVAGAIALLLAGQIADPALAVGLTVALAIAGMSLLGCLHPPAGGTAALVIMAGPELAAAGWRLLAMPIALNAVLLIVVATVFHRLTGHSYPHRPAPAPAAIPWQTHYDPANLDAVLDDWDEVLAVSRDDLDVLIREVLKRGTSAPG